jgi:hypothetical protein
MRTTHPTPTIVPKPNVKYSTCVKVRWRPEDVGSVGVTGCKALS